MKTTLTTLIRTSLVIIALVTFSSCGQKGPLVLEKVPVETSQAPIENSIDSIPLETPDQAASGADTEETPKPATTK